MFGEELVNALTIKELAMPDSYWDRNATSPQSARTAILGTPNEALHLRTANEEVHSLWQTIGYPRTRVALELGAGLGRLAFRIAPNVGWCLATDSSLPMLKLLMNDPSRPANLWAIRTSGVDLAGIGNATVDLVYAVGLFVHLTPQERFHYVKEAHRILTPGGNAYVDCLTIDTGAGWEVFEQSSRGEGRPPIWPTSGNEIVAYFNKAGFHDTTRICRGSRYFVFAKR